MKLRRQFEQSPSLQDRLRAFAEDVRAKAAGLPPGTEQEVLLRKARQAETALRLDRWANSSGLQPPR
jgi:hypothetical protein